MEYNYNLNPDSSDHIYSYVMHNNNNWILPPHRVFDRDGNGYITRDELQTAMDMIGETVTEQQLTEMLALADLDKDGKINYEGEFEL